MKPSVPWKDILLFGGLTLVSIVSFIITLYVTDVLAAIVTTAVTSVGFIIVFLIILLKWVTNRPQIVTKHKTCVWTDGIQAIKNPEITKAIDVYIEELPKLDPKVKPYQLLAMFDQLCIEFKKDKINVSGFGWKAVDKAGLQRGKNIMVEWRGTFHKSALYHEFHHAVDELILNKPCDYKHERLEWWALVPYLNTKLWKGLWDV